MTSPLLIEKNQNKGDHSPVIWTAELPPLKANLHQSWVVQFSAYLKKLMVDNGSSSLMLPSVLKLAQFFNLGLTQSIL